MDNSVLGGGILSGPTAGILDLEASIHRHQQHHLSHAPLSHHHHMQSIGGMAGLDSDHSLGLLDQQPKSNRVSKGIPINFGKGRAVVSITPSGTTATNNNNNSSDEDEPSFTECGNETHFNGARGKKGSPWQRMKWNDGMVRLLITVVSCVGDDGTLVGSTERPKRKSGVLQKKGKWKTVSKIMMEKGCFVSPQQCEDKFNDLNKRYKRLNDILGRGKTCMVVENPILLDSMGNLSAKIKDDVRKILSSKHLFYKEMCAYHSGQRIPNSHDLDLQGYCMPIARCSKESNGFDEEEDNDEENDECDDDVDNEGDDIDAEDDETHESIVDFGKKKVRLNEENDGFWSQSVVLDNSGAEMDGILQEKPPWEQRQWFRNRMLQLQEQRVGYQAQALELEKRRFKWQRFCSKRDRELDRLRLENERMRLENERMTFYVKQREMEIDLKMSETSLNPVTLVMDRFQGRDQIELGRV